MRIIRALIDSIKMRRKHTPRQRILLTFLASPSDEQSGGQLLRPAHVSAGTLYPILLELEDQNIVTSRWQEYDQPTFPRRRLYSLTERGEIRARIETTFKR